MSDNEQNLPSYVKVMVDNVSDGDLASAADAFDAAVQDKVTAHIANYKSVIAQNSFELPEPTAGIDTGITGAPEEVEEE